MNYNYLAWISHGVKFYVLSPFVLLERIANFNAKYYDFMKLTSALFSLLAAGVMTVGSVNAQSKSTYVGTNGTVYSNYKGAGEVACKDCDDEPDVYCYQCRAFHTHKDYAYYNNRENCHELGHMAHCADGVCHEGADCHDHLKGDCHECKDYSHDYYNMDHDYDNCGGDYIVKYRANKVKVKCTGCNAKWKYYYNDYHSNHHYVYDKDDRVIVSYQD